MRLSEAVKSYIIFAQAKYSGDIVLRYKNFLLKVIELLNDPDMDAIIETTEKSFFELLTKEINKQRYLKTSQEPTRLLDIDFESSTEALRSFSSWIEANLTAPTPRKAILQRKLGIEPIKAFTPEEVKRLFDAAEWMIVYNSNGETTHLFHIHRQNYERDVALLEFLLDTGITVSELCRIAIGDVNIETGNVVVKPFANRSKNKSRTVYLGASARQSIRRYLGDRSSNKEEYLFVLSEAGVRKILQNIGKKAKVDDVQPKRFRATFATKFLRINKDPYTLMQLLGHSGFDATRHYLDLLDSDFPSTNSFGSPSDLLHCK